MTSMPDNELRDHAGPYGFTRREVGVIVTILAVCVAVIAYDEWRDSKRPMPAWVINDVLIEPSETIATSDTSRESIEDSVPAPARSLVPATRDHSDLIDVNSADQRALARLPGIGTELARRIIEERNQNGHFVNLTDLQRVRGIGPRKAAMLSGWVKFSSNESTTEDTVGAQ